jgi:hypothetical protein
MRAESENVNAASLRYTNKEDLTAGLYEGKDSGDGNNYSRGSEPEITFEDSSDSKTTTM